MEAFGEFYRFNISKIASVYAEAIFMSVRKGLF